MDKGFLIKAAMVRSKICSSYEKVAVLLLKWAIALMTKDIGKFNRLYAFLSSLFTDQTCFRSRPRVLRPMGKSTARKMYFGGARSG